MAAVVSSAVGIMNGGYNEDQQVMNKESRGGDGGGKSTVLITRDLLGGCYTLDSKELDLDLQVPIGWEKRLDLKSGKVYLQRCNSPTVASLSLDHKQQPNGVVSKLQDLNFPASLQQPQLTLFDESNLDLKLDSSPSTYQSVCTLDKVKSALERAEKEMIKKRSISMSKSSSLPSRETVMDYQEKSTSSFAAGCPSCLLYVLISTNNPRCPRCNTIVHSSIAMKKPRIDLNI
ncbi:Ribosomal RNA processing protein [Actinidia chinensis var. chinensis]|uniref:Ribosomal RNA processing protein n=1 Tax=Actinidia chinensis var. chinensis TaxID=1590841 RepID=A0A2R6PR33_ACTCC|nr:Ribosomal RNA processing protein [Actinidia chinensis var. chinensis]